MGTAAPCGCAIDGVALSRASLGAPAPGTPSPVSHSVDCGAALAPLADETKLHQQRKIVAQRKRTAFLTFSWYERARSAFFRARFDGSPSFGFSPLVGSSVASQFFLRCCLSSTWLRCGTHVMEPSTWVRNE